MHTGTGGCKQRLMDAYRYWWVHAGTNGRIQGQVDRRRDLWMHTGTGGHTVDVHKNWYTHADSDRVWGNQGDQGVL